LSSFVLLFILLGFNVNSVNAVNCAPGELFNSTTGQACGTTTTVVECPTGDLFSSVTGQPCTVWRDNPAGANVATLLDTLFKRELAIGSKGEDVKALQQILKDAGFLSGKVDGSYGPITRNAVTKYQKENSLSTTGKANLDTFERIKIMPWYLLCPLVKDSEGFDATCPTIPAIAPPVISGIKGPQSLNVYQQGTWIITAYDKNKGNLSYSVDWEDNPATPGFSVQHTSPLLQQNAIFTHSYSRSGIYTPKFYVQNENGQSAQTSLSVNVGNTTTPSITVLSPNGGESWQKGTTQTIKWQDRSPLPSCIVNSDGTSGEGCYIRYDLKLVPYYPPCTIGFPCTAISLYTVPYTIAKGVSGQSYQWSAGQVLPIETQTTLAPDGSYTVQICQSGTNTCDQSDSAFTIAAESRKLSPCNNLGDVNADGFVTEDDAEVVRQIVSGLRPASTEETRRSDVNASGTVNTLDVTLIRRYVTGLDITFSGCTQPSITVLSPNGGEVWPVGSTQVIKWNNTSGGPVNLTLSNYLACLTATPACGAPTVLYQLANNLYGSNYFWTTGKTSSGGDIPAGEYKVTVSSATNGSVTDQSDSVFTITAPATTSNTLDLSASAYSAFSSFPSGCTSNQGYSITTGKLCSSR